MVFSGEMELLKNIHIGHAAGAHKGKMLKRAAEEKRAGESPFFTMIFKLI
jgi:hypothetical protein